MPKFAKKEGINSSFNGIQSKVSAEITPELGKEAVNIMERQSSSLSLKQQLEKDQQSRYLERIGGFPMPPLFRHDDENHSNNINTREYDTAPTIIESEARSNNVISSHIRNHVNRGRTKIFRPPALESYKRFWHDIRGVVGDDPQNDDQLRREVFARKLYRGEILVGKNSSMNNANDRNRKGSVQQRRLSELSVSGNSDSGAQINNPTKEETAVI